MSWQGIKHWIWRPELIKTTQFNQELNPVVDTLHSHISALCCQQKWCVFIRKTKRKEGSYLSFLGSVKYTMLYPDKSVFFIILALVLVCAHAIFTLQRYQQTLLTVSFVSSVTAHHHSDWLKDLHSLFVFLFSFMQRPNQKWDYVCRIQYNMYRGQRGPSGLLRNSILSLLFTSWRTKSLVAGWFNISSLSDKQRGNLYSSILTYLACIFCFVSVPYTLPKYPIACWLADMFLSVVKWPSGYRNVNVDLKKNLRYDFCSRPVGGQFYHLQTSIIVDLAVTSRAQLCLSHNQCGPLRVKVYLQR